MEANDILAEIVVELLLEKDNKVLLQERANTDYENGKYGFVGGHVAKGETLRQALIREAKEEANIDLKEEDLECVFVANKTGNKNCINFVFKASKFSGTPQIMEKDKCTDLSWFDLQNLPKNIIDMERRVIRKFYFKQHTDRRISNVIYFERKNTRKIKKTPSIKRTGIKDTKRVR